MTRVDTSVGDYRRFHISYKYKEYSVDVPSFQSCKKESEDVRNCMEILDEVPNPSEVRVNVWHI